LDIVAANIGGEMAVQSWEWMDAWVCEIGSPSGVARQVVLGVIYYII